jgi:transposase-like protein
MRTGVDVYPRAAVERAMKVQEVILLAMAQKLTWHQAAEIIGISDRQMRRWRERYEEHGYDGLMDRRRGVPGGKRVPPTQETNKVGLDAGLLAALNLAQADLHGLLIERRLVAHAPAQVDGLKARVVLLAQLAQLREDLSLQSVALGLQVLKGRADKYPECACRSRHRSGSRERTP